MKGTAVNLGRSDHESAVMHVSRAAVNVACALASGCTSRNHPILKQSCFGAPICTSLVLVVLAVTHALITCIEIDPDAGMFWPILPIEEPAGHTNWSTVYSHETVSPSVEQSAARVYPAALNDEDRGTVHFVLCLDMWERMVNVQTGLKRLVQLGVDARFTVVEPFVFESKVSQKLSTPEHFLDANLQPQTASMYFDTAELFTTKRFVTFDSFVNMQQTTQPGDNGMGSIAKHTEKNHVLVLDAVLHFDWSDEKTNKDQTSNSNNSNTQSDYFYWCDDELLLHNIRQKPTGSERDSRAESDFWYISEHVAVRGALCVSPKVTFAPREFSAAYFSTLFSMVSNRSAFRRTAGIYKSALSPRAVSVAFLNYRKHVFTGYVSSAGSRPFAQKNPSMGVGKLPIAIANAFHLQKMKRAPYIGLQMRTGKAWVLSQHDPDRFRKWLRKCSHAAVRAVQAERRELGKGARVYLASDMYNDGWKGGEKCPATVELDLARTRRFIERALKPDRYVPEPGMQDGMGLAGAVDAAMCVKADRFVHTTPSSMGQWVHDQRAPRNRAKTRRVECDVFSDW
jgi:hypothetical protein